MILLFYFVSEHYYCCSKFLFTTLIDWLLSTGNPLLTTFINNDILAYKVFLGFCMLSTLCLLSWHGIIHDLSRFMFLFSNGTCEDTDMFDAWFLQMSGNDVTKNGAWVQNIDARMQHGYVCNSIKSPQHQKITFPVSNR